MRIALFNSRPRRTAVLLGCLFAGTTLHATVGWSQDGPDAKQPVAQPAQENAKPEAAPKEKIVGAAAAILQAKEAQDKARAEGGDLAPTGNRWVDRVNKFKATRLSLAPDAAAKQWLDLATASFDQDEWEAFTQAVSALPAPEAWPALAEQIMQRPIANKDNAFYQGHSLRILAGTLINDPKLITPSMEALNAKAQTKRGEEKEEFQMLVETIQAAVDRTAEPEYSVSADAFAEYVKNAVEQGREWGEVMSVDVPDLVKALGEDKSRELLTNALQQPVMLEFRVGPSLTPTQQKTLEIARQATLANIGKVKVAPWTLVGEDNAIQMYEALVKQFDAGPAEPEADAEPGEEPGEPNPGKEELERLRKQIEELQRVQVGQSWELRRARDTADGYYLLALLEADRDEDAKAHAVRIFTNEDSSLSYTLPRMIQQRGLGDKAWALMNEMMDAAERPDYVLWESYIDLAQQLGKPADLSARLEKALQDNELKKNDPDLHAYLQEQMYEAYLVTGQVDKAIAALTLTLGDLEFDSDSMRYDHPVKTLAELGRLLDQPELIEQAMDWLAKAEAGDRHDVETALLYEKLGKTAKAEQILHGLLLNYVAAKAAPMRENEHRFNDFNDFDTDEDPLIALTTFYHRMGRHEDVLQLFEQAPWWPTQDLSQLMQGYDAQIELAVAASAALADSGRLDQARQIALAVIDISPDHDPAYEALVAIGGARVIAELDALYARDQFEERPLIWKAHVLNSLGKHEQAAEVARKAITIDPSDGDQGKGDRMRVYAVLADALEGMGNKKEAGFYREVVTSIRMSEDADDLFSVGLTEQAAALYQKALTRFADAYCIQSRLAVRLFRMGKIDEAAEHYRRAFELMPDSFGRVESHCFGCEGVFSGEIAQEIAEKVFTEMVKADPKKPQLHYLLGYLRSSQDRHEEALKHFQQAVTLDPDYVNAWDKLDSLSNDIKMTPQERDEIAFNIMRLDPLQRHGRANTDSVQDLARLWKALKRRIELQPQKPDKLFTLATETKIEAVENLDPAAAELRRIIREHAGFNAGRFDPYDDYDDYLKDPADVIAQHRVIQALNMLSLQGQW